MSARHPLRIVAFVSLFALCFVFLATPPLRAQTAEDGLLGAGSQDELNRALADGEAALEAGRNPEAISHFTRAFQISQDLRFFGSPEGTEAARRANIGRARAYVAMEDPETALRYFGDALFENDYYAPALIGRGELHLRTNSFFAAKADFQKAVEADWQNADALLGLAKAQIGLFEIEPGLRTMERYLALNDQNAEAYRVRAQAQAMRGDQEAAFADIDRAISLDPNNYESHFVAGRIYLSTQQLDRAGQAIEQAIATYVPPETDPYKLPFVQGHLLKTQILIEMGKAAEGELQQQAYQAAIDETNRLMGLLPDKPAVAGFRRDALFYRGVAERLQNRLADAIETFSESIGIDPNTAEPYFRRGICFYLIGDTDLAIADFRQAVTLDVEQTDPRPLLWEGFAHAQAGDLYEAIRAYGLAIAKSDRYVQAYVNRGLIYMQLGNYARAIDDFNEAIRLEPTNAEHYFKRGLAYAYNGDTQAAADSFTNAVTFNNSHLPAYRRLSTVMASLGRPELAAEYERRAAELAATE